MVDRLVLTDLRRLGSQIYADWGHRFTQIGVMINLNKKKSVLICEVHL